MEQSCSLSDAPALKCEFNSLMFSNYPELVHKHPTHLGDGMVRVGSMRFDVCTITEIASCVMLMLVRGGSSTSNLHGMKFVL